MAHHKTTTALSHPAAKALDPRRGSGNGNTEDLRQSVVRNHLQLHRISSRYSIRKNHGESIALLFLIQLLENSRPALTITEAGLIMSIPPATISRKMRELASAGLITLYTDPSDKRRIHPRISILGQEFLSECESVITTSRDLSVVPDNSSVRTVVSRMHSWSARQDEDGEERRFA